MQQPFRVFIVDDNSLYRRILTMAVEATPGPTQVETAPSGAIALKKIPLFAPDLVLLDIEMPDMNGIEVLKAIRAEYPRIAVALVSGVNSRSADITIEGLTSGASDFVSKPVGANTAENAAQLRGDLERIFQAVQQRIEARAARAARPEPTTQPRAEPALARAMPALLPARVEVVGIGVSTGGPTALEQVLPALPATLRVPVLIVQHMPPLFTDSLAKALDRRCALRVCEAAEGQLLEPGGVYIAPGGRHLRVEPAPAGGPGPRLVARLDDGAPVNSCKPAVDVLFRSLAEVVGRHTLAVVMTGMGQDGLEGVADIKARQGYCLTQSEDTCTVYGMPQAVDQAGLSDERVPLGELAARIVSLMGVGTPQGR